MSRHKLGFAVKVLGEGGLPSHDTRRWQSDPHLRVSLERLGVILDFLDRHDMRMYRMASGLAPYASHPEFTQFHNQVEECASELAAVGRRARELDVRLSFHPGQYTVLNSENPDVRSAAAVELESHAAILHAMGQPDEAVIVLHVGGAAGGMDAARERFARGVEALSEHARSRLVVENDDRSFGLSDVLPLARRLGLRIVWDVLHHRCHDREQIPDGEALSLALDTWPTGQTPKVHFSSPRLDIEVRRPKRGKRRLLLPELRAHADLVDPIAFESFLCGTAAGRRDFDLMLEAKAKDLALMRLRAQLDRRGIRSESGRLRVGPFREGCP
jgi:UV DNA damage endonuclease